MTKRTCPGCERAVKTRHVGTSPHIDTGEPVDQLKCGFCGGVYDAAEYGDRYE